jgi:hypothetical protein
MLFLAKKSAKLGIRYILRSRYILLAQRAPSRQVCQQFEHSSLAFRATLLS